jgi:hypothetical protein
MGGKTIAVADVLFGDVWVCSGQSNMAFAAGVPGNDPAAEAEIAKAYASDPGASIDGKYMDSTAGIAAAPKDEGRKAIFLQFALFQIGILHIL